MEHLSRREFLKRTSAAGLWAASGMPVAEGLLRPRGIVDAFDQVTLGRTGIKTSFLAQGTGVNGTRRTSAHTRMGRKDAIHLIRHGIDNGLRFMDAADLYGTHPYIRDALREVPRDDYVLLSKVWPRGEDWNDWSGGAAAEVDRFRKELGTDRIDICLLHCMLDADWAETLERGRDELSELKQRGVVRAVGVSCHDYGALVTAASHPWVDVILARINNQGYNMDGTGEEIAAVLRTARANGKAVVGMKIFGVGKINTPEGRESSIRHVVENDLVDAMTIGMLKPAEMDDNIATIGRVLRS